MSFNTQVIYSNGRYRVVPQITLLRIEVDGRVLQTVGAEDIEHAVSEVDRLAENDGCFAHCSAVAGAERS